MMSSSSVNMSPAYILGSSIHMQHKDHVVPEGLLGSTSWSHGKPGGMATKSLKLLFFH